MEKLDLKKSLKQFYAPSSGVVEVVDVPEFRFAMIDGRIALGETPASSAEFQRHIEALYGASFTLKFMSKLRKEDPVDYTVMALEGLWWTDSGHFSIPQQEPWNYTLMILQPEHITLDMFNEAVGQLVKKKDNPALYNLRFESFREGLSVQMMHIGPYANEPTTIEKMLAFANEHNYKITGKHHEIYLGDPRRAKPEKLRTVLRYAVRQ